MQAGFGLSGGLGTPTILHYGAIWVGHCLAPAGHVNLDPNSPLYQWPLFGMRPARVLNKRLAGQLSD